MSDAREAVLARVRQALGPSPTVPEVPREYRVAAAGDPGGAVERFCERVAEYRATVTRAERGEVEGALARICRERGTRRAVLAPGAPWRLDGVETVADDALSPGDLDLLDAVVTGCALAIAETGTIVLDGSPRCGRRAITLVPDHHLCVVGAQQVVAGVPEAIAVLHEAATARRPITLVSGPSATSDIELRRVEGVHGPRVLDVIVEG